MVQERARKLAPTLAQQFTAQGLDAAISMLSCQECMAYADPQFAGAAFAIARVLSVDDKLKRELQFRNDEDVDASKHTFFTRIARIEAGIATWRAQVHAKKTKTKQPPLGDEGRRFTALQRNLSEYDSWLQQYSIGNLYAKTALKCGAVQLFRFFSWCTSQQEQQRRFLNVRRASYAEICKLWKRHPDTPSIPKSWPPELGASAE